MVVYYLHAIQIILGEQIKEKVLEIKTKSVSDLQTIFVKHLFLLYFPYELLMNVKTMIVYST